MTSHPIPQDELAAVNVMLGNIGMAPINTLTGTVTADIALARNILTEVSLAVQSKGWEFNREHDYPLNINEDGFINLADNILRVDVPRTYFYNVDVTQRGSRLYDKTNRTYVFTQNLKGDVIISLPFDEMPPAARQYIGIRAARVFQKRVLGSETLDGFTEEDELQALVTMKDAESENADHNIFDHPDVGQIVWRRHRP